MLAYDGFDRMTVMLQITMIPKVIQVMDWSCWKSHYLKQSWIRLMMWHELYSPRELRYKM